MKDESDITLYIQDDGIGMSEELVSQLQAGSVSSNRHAGYGLKNINERIKLNYGDMYGLAFESKLGAGTTVSVKIPAINSKSKI